MQFEFYTNLYGSLRSFYQQVMYSASLEFQDTFQAHIQQQCLAQLVSNSAKKLLILFLARNGDHLRIGTSLC